MSFEIAIKVDPGSSEQKIAGVERALDKLEAKGPKVGPAISRGFREGSTAAEKAKGPIDVFSRSLDGLAQAIGRERDMLERVHGPMRQFAQDVQTLDALHRKGTISAKQYGDELANVRNRAGAGNPLDAVSLGAPPKAASGGGFGGAMRTAGPLLAAGAMMKGADDEYSRSAFSAARFTEAGKDVNAVLKEQVALAHQLRAPLDQTMELYDAVRDGTDDLNMSRKEQMDLTRSLGAAMRLDNKTLQEAGGLMTTLSYAWASGSITGRELKGVMKQSGEIAEALTTKFGKTRPELIAMADAGQLSMLKFREAIQESGQAWAKELADRPKSMSESLHEFATEAKLALGKPLPSMKEFEKQAIAIHVALQRDDAILAAVTEATGGWTIANQDAVQKVLDLNKQSQHLGDAFSHLAEQMRIIRTLTPSMFGDMSTGATKALGIVNMVVGRLGDVTATAAGYDPWGRTSKKSGGGGDLKTFAYEDEVGFTSSQANENQASSVANSFDIVRESNAAMQASFQPSFQMREYEEYLKSIAASSQKYAAEMASAQDGIARGFNAIDKELRDTAALTEQTMVRAFRSAEDALVQMAMTGKLEWRSMVNSMISDLARLAIRKAILGLVDAIGGGGIPSALGGGATQAFEGLYGRAPGYATGGSFMVGGKGGTDTTPVRFMASPGERVTVETPAQQVTGSQQSAPAAAPRIQVINSFDRRELLQALDSPEGATVVHNILRKNPGLLKR